MTAAGRAIAGTARPPRDDTTSSGVGAVPDHPVVELRDAGVTIRGRPIWDT
jgi:hypothetical protein